ncbi:MAG: 4Fe-4S binding protein [Oscillospiraceae bacterium]|nr:4Fe-4S binding protein [Oscillospiraceae bacterium]
MDNMNTTWWQRHRPGTRRLVQLYSALLYNAHLKGFIDGEIYVGKAKYACVPGFNCYSCPGAIGACPLGSIQNALASSGHQAGWYVLGILTLFGVILGRTVCGWLCPLGLIQELLHKIPTPKLRKTRVTRALSTLKYIILAVFVVAIPLWYGLKHNLPLPAFCKYICPAGTLEGAMGLLSNPANAEKFSMLGILFTRKFVIMLVIGLACVFCYRSFCRFLCPLGAVYGLFNRFNVIGVKVDSDRCNGCGSCVRACGMDVRHVGDHECIHCGRCMEVCGQKAITLKAGSCTLKAPAGSSSEAEEQQRKKRGKVLWGLALGLLYAALLWFNFLDPAVKKRSSSNPAPIPQEEAVPGSPAVEAEESGTAAATSAPDVPADEAPGPVSYESDAPIGYEVGQQLADFTTPTFDGGEFHLAELRGKIVFINLWATYCTPCVQELPEFEKLVEEHEDELVILAVHSSLTADQEPEDYVSEKGWDSWKILFALDDEDEDTIFTTVNGSTTLPQTIVLNRRGEVLYNRVGSVTPEMLEALYSQADASVP